MDEPTILLKNFILKSKATNDEHQQAILWLNQIHQDYKKQLAQQKQEDNAKQ